MTRLPIWAKPLLQFAGMFNILAGLSMICFYHEGYKLLGISKPELIMPVQVMGILVSLFGVGYLIVASNPVENRNILVLGFLSKAISSLLALYYVAVGPLTLSFVPVLFFADIIYLLPFYVIIRKLRNVAA